jgi:FAD binding domain
MTRGDMALPDALDVQRSIDKERAAAFVRAAIGLPDSKVVIEDIAPWHAVAEAAERFQEGRVFLVGDAEHVMPPMGGFGGNTGVQDTHNLAWKLALVLKGLAGPALLSTYNTERQPIGELAMQQAYTRYALRVVPERDKKGMKPLVDDLSMEIGYRYHSPAIATEPDSGASLTEDPRQSKHAAPRWGSKARAGASRRSICSARISCCWRRPAAAPGARPRAPLLPSLRFRSTLIASLGARR